MNVVQRESPQQLHERKCMLHGMKVRKMNLVRKEIRVKKKMLPCWIFLWITALVYRNAEWQVLLFAEIYWALPYTSTRSKCPGDFWPAHLRSAPTRSATIMCTTFLKLRLDRRAPKKITIISRPRLPLYMSRGESIKSGESLSERVRF